MYLLFYGDRYYPSMAWNDFHGKYESIEIATNHMLQLKLKDMTTGYDWFQIVDLETLKVVKEG